MPGELLIHYGNPGSGKTLFALKEIILPCVKEHRPFFTNITGISVSALSALTDIHQAFIKYYEVKDIHDVIAYFDNEQISHDGVFILDEMKDFIDDDKAVSWLESRINVMRKHSVDFVLIAQQPKKNYIHPDIIALANACNVYRTRKRENDGAYVDKYYVNGGMPKILNDEVSNAVNKLRVRKPVEMYNCYTTSESAFYTGAEDKTFYGLKWYQERQWRGRFFMIIGVLVAIVLGLYGVFKLLGFQGEVNNGGKDVQQQQRKPLAVESSASSIFGKGADPLVDGSTPSCYNWKICDGKRCRTDIGIFPNAYDIDGPICLGNRCYSMCQAGDGFSSRGGLLHPGEQVSKGTQPGVRDK